MLAETVSIDFGALLVVLIIGLIGLAVFVTLVVFGFVLAPRAARGSRRALRGWIVIVTIEAMLCLVSLAVGLSGGFSLPLLAAPAAVALQGAIFVRARRNTP